MKENAKNASQNFNIVDIHLYRWTEGVTKTKTLEN